MTSSVRYKYVNNLTANPYSSSSFPAQTDGDDKQFKFVRRVLGAADVGGTVGKTRDPLGAILDVIPPYYNVLWIQGITYRPSAQIVGNIRGYYTLDSATIGGHAVNIIYALNSDNTIRVIDDATDAAAYLAEGDVVTANIILGKQVDSNDVMNY